MENGYIRSVERNDIPACVNVIRQSFQTVADQFGFTPENAPGFTSYSMSEQRLNQQFDEHRPMFVYCADGVICGFCSLCMQDGGECELNNLAVLPQYRHNGIGRKLLEHCRSEAKKLGCRSINLSIVEENTVLRQWYEQNGAQHLGTKKFDFFPFTCGYMRIALMAE